MNSNLRKLAGHRMAQLTSLQKRELYQRARVIKRTMREQRAIESQYPWEEEVGGPNWLFWRRDAELDSLVLKILIEEGVGE